MMDNQGLPSPRVLHRVLYLQYPRNIYERIRISRANILLTWREDSSVSGENKDVFWASNWTTRHTVCVADTAREAAVNCGWLLQRLSRFLPATHHRATLSLRLSPSPSSSYIERQCRFHLLESLRRHPDPLSLSLPTNFRSYPLHRTSTTRTEKGGFSTSRANERPCPPPLRGREWI